ncbi:hypothetical protein [Geminocystis sp.]|uniref:hypothetical protein n=1 Tax=Geminocystis sp. TaxID=2664100 RepID=UPI00359323F7
MTYQKIRKKIIKVWLYGVSVELEEGDTMNILLTNDSIQLTLFDPHFEVVMAAYKEGKDKYRNAMRELADG